MHVNTLINCVYIREPLWNKRNTNYRNRELCEKLWADVAEEMNVTSEKVKLKWKGLRDTFRKELLRVKSKRASGTKAGRKFNSRWLHYTNLTFLSDMMTVRNSAKHQNVADTFPIEFIEDDGSQHGGKHNDDETSTHRNTEIYIEEEIDAPIVKQKRATQYKNTAKDHYMKQKKKKSPSPERKERMNTDSEYQFLLSLWPYLRQIPQSRRLLVRQKLQSVLVEELIREHESPLSQVVVEELPAECSMKADPIQAGES